MVKATETATQEHNLTMWMIIAFCYEENDFFFIFVFFFVLIQLMRIRRLRDDGLDQIRNYLHSGLWKAKCNVYWNDAINHLREFMFKLFSLSLAMNDFLFRRKWNIIFSAFSYSQIFERKKKLKSRFRPIKSAGVRYSVIFLVHFYGKQ